MLFISDGTGDRFGLSPDWFEKVQAALHKKKEDKAKSSKKKSSLSTDNVLEHIHARFSELAASTLAAAHATSLKTNYLVLSQPVLLLNAVCLAEKQQTPIL
jgi:hypothetical protein